MNGLTLALLVVVAQAAGAAKALAAAPGDPAAVRAFAAGDRIEFLPYNAAAGAKYPMLGRKYTIDAPRNRYG